MRIGAMSIIGLLGLAACQLGWALDSSASISVQTVLKTDHSWDGKPLAYPQGQAEVTGIVVTIAPGGETGWHRHPVPSFGMVLEGELEVRLKDGRTTVLKAGDALAEVVDTAHNGRTVGAVPVKLVVFYAGVVGQKLTVKDDAH
jgi:quercetin dioxygenase-like cupin family protein